MTRDKQRRGPQDRQLGRLWRRRARTLLVASVVSAVMPLIPLSSAHAQATGLAVLGPLTAVDEGQKAIFTIGTVNAPSNPITLKFSTDGSPNFLLSSAFAEPGKDFLPVIGKLITLDHDNGYQYKVEVTTLDDGVLEGPEPILAMIHDVSNNVTVSVQNAVAVLGPSDLPGVAVPGVPPVTIPQIPNLGPLFETPSLSINDVTVTEGTEGTPEASFTVRRAGNTALALNTEYRTVAQTATAGEDYTSQSGTLYFDMWETEETLRVPIVADDATEDTETFALELFNVNGGVLADPVGVGTILDDDPAPEAQTAPRSSPSAPPAARDLTTADGGGYWLHDRSGRALPFGSARPIGDVTGLLSKTSSRIVAMATDQSTSGAWLADNKGGVYSLGSARFFGSMPGLLNAGAIKTLPEIADVSAIPGGDGYALLSKDGGVFTFGNARFFGSLHTLVGSGALRQTPEAVALAYTPSGLGYWIVSADGGVFTFGDAKFHGSVPGLVAAKRVAGSARIVDIAPAPGGTGYALVDEFGGVFTFGDARFHGSVPALAAQGLVRGPIRILGAEYTPDGNGYWVFGRTGGVFTFGAAKFFGTAQFPDDPPPAPKAKRTSKKKR